MSFKSLMIFLAGAAVGAAGTFYFAKTRYLTIAEEEIESIKEACDRKIDNMLNDISNTEEETVKETSKTRAEANNKYKEAIAETKNYTGYFPTEKKPEVISSKPKFDPPFVIGDEDFAEANGYAKVTYTYFEEDGVFTDISEEPVEDVLKFIGEGNLEHFGEYEEGVLFVRNDEYRTDYEIIHDAGSYAVYAGE